MLLFSTILDVNEKMQPDEFIRLVLDWNKGSPHPENVIPNIHWNGERNIRYGEGGLSLEIVEYRSKRLIAVRYEKKTEDGIIWDTDYVMDFRQQKLCIRLDRSYTADALDVDSNFSTPYFIKLLIERGYLKDDNKLALQYRPVTITEENVGLVTDVINGKSDYRLPVVFVSKTYYDDDPVNVSLLAHRLKGIAHVMLEGSTTLNPTLQKDCDGKNEYYGAIGVYFPAKGMKPRRFMYRNRDGQDDVLLEKVVLCVVHHCSAQRVDPLFTWQGVNNELLKEGLANQKEGRLAAEEARKNAEAEVVKLLENLSEEESRIRKQAFEEANAGANELLDQFDEDMKKMQEQIAALTRDNEALINENYGLRTKLLSKDSVPVLYMGDEQEFYPGEIKDLILEALSEAAKNIQDGTRRADVVADIIENNDYQALSAAKAEEIKRLLKNYDGMSARTRQALKDLGFEITEEGKHYKVTYYGDGRYQSAFSKTPSDVRTGKNCSQELVNMCF